MSAIAGILSLDGAPLRSDLIECLTRPMASRGPDGIQHWANGIVALGHCMLRSTPESMAEHQPLVSADGKLVLVFDGRLDNRKELVRLLGLPASALKTSSDVELVLGAYRLWSRDCPKHLLGDFSFAVWDARRQRLFCVRDPVGARQVYYVCNKNFFAFASDDEVLTHLPGISSQPCRELIAHLLVNEFQGFAPQQTWLQEVQALLPAHSVSVVPGGEVFPDRYWQFEQGNELKYASDQEYEEAFLEVFCEAVRTRLRLVGEPAAMISGGMDSAGIAAMLGRLVSDCPTGQYHAYSAIADDLDSSLESRCILSMTGRDHVKPHRVSVPSLVGEVGLADLQQAAWTNAHPVDNSILLPAMMCLAASRNGHRVILHGVSGDLAMGDFPRYIAPLLRMQQWRDAWQESKDASRNNTYLNDLSPLQLLLRNAWTAYVPLRVRARISRIRKGSYQTPQGMELLNPDFVRELDLTNRLRSQSSLSMTSNQPGSREDFASSVFGQSGVISGLSGYQRMASRYGVEMRDPWADRRVLEFFLHLPLNQLVRKGWTKYLARSAFAQELDDSVRWRSDKEHLGWIFVDRLMDESKEFIDYSMKHDLAVIEDYINIDSIRNIYAQYTSSNSIGKKEQLYNLMTLVHWVKRLTNHA